MQIQKILYSTVVLTDPNLIYSKNTEQILQNEIVKKYLKKCYNGCYITKIIEIINRSELIYVETRSDIAVTCNVAFKVDCIVVEINEVIHDCTIARITDRAILAKSDNCAVYVSQNVALQSLKVNQVIPVMSAMSRFTVSASEYSLSCRPFSPYTDNIIVQLKYDDNVELKKDIYLIKKHINKKYFVDLLYPYKSIQKEWKKIDICELFEQKPKYIRFILSGLYCSNDVKESDYNCSTQNYSKFLPFIKKQCIIYKLNIEGLCKTYDTKEKIKDNNNIWSIYTKFKK